MITFKKFTRETLHDARQVVKEVFGVEACDKLSHYLDNPMLDIIPDSDSGEVAYSNASPVGFEGMFPVRLYYGSRPLIGCIGSTVCMLPIARDNLGIVELLQRINAPRFGSVLFYGNTANPHGMRVNKALGMRVNGPKSWANKRIAILRPFAFIMYLLISKCRCRMVPYWMRTINKRIPEFKYGDYVVRRLEKIDSFVFDAFWKRYLSSNTGLVASRTSTELNWVFGDRVATNRLIVCGLFKGSEMCGYAIMMGGGWSWSVGDAIVMNNDKSLFEIMLRGALTILKRCTHSSHCYIEGFPDYVQPEIEKLFKVNRHLSNNAFGWKFSSPTNFAVNYDELNGPGSWFFGPYDGDLCM